MNKTARIMLGYGIATLLLSLVLFVGIIVAGYYLEMRNGPVFAAIQQAEKVHWVVQPDSACFPDSAIQIGDVVHLHTQIRANGFYQPKLLARLNVPEGLLLKGEPRVVVKYDFGHYRFDVMLALQPYRPGTYDSMVLELEGTRAYPVDFDANAIPEPRLALVLPTLYARLPDTVTDIGLADEAAFPSESGIPTFLFILLGGFLLLAVGFAAYYGLKRKQVAPEISYRDRARQQLDKLRDALAQRRASPERIFAQLSDVVRQYLARRFQVAFTTQSSEEFFQSLAQTEELNSTQRHALHDFIEAADRVKFAGMKAESSQVESAINEAAHLIEETPENVDISGGQS